MENSRRKRISVGLAFMLAAASAVVTGAIAWGAQSERVTQLRTDVEDIKRREHERDERDRERDRQAATIIAQLATINAQNLETLRRLDRIERRFFNDR